MVDGLGRRCACFTLHTRTAARSWLTGTQPGGFERNVEQRPVRFMPADHGRASAEPDYAVWFRFVGDAAHEDPFADLGRVLVVADITPLAALDVRFPAVVAAHWLPTLRLGVQCSRPLGLGVDIFARARVSSPRGGVVSAEIAVHGADGVEVAAANQLGLLQAY